MTDRLAASRARLLARRTELADRERSYRSQGFHASADVLADRIETIDWQLDVLNRQPLPVPAPGVNLGKVLVTPSIQSQFETPTPKSASV